MSAEVRHERVVIETDYYRIEGNVKLPQEGYRSSLSDYLNRQGLEFVLVEEAELIALDGSGRNWSTPSLMLARRYIRLVVPAGGDNE
jgi:hypothetical protein